MRLLVADDNPVNQKVACAYLKSLGVSLDQIDTVADGKEAVARCQQVAFDMVFMDIQMPEMDGFEATREILQQNQHKPLIVALTANCSHSNEDKFRDFGMQMAIYKPVSKESFRQALELLPGFVTE